MVCNPLISVVKSSPIFDSVVFQWMASALPESLLIHCFLLYNPLQFVVTLFHSNDVFEAAWARDPGRTHILSGLLSGGQYWVRDCLGQTPWTNSCPQRLIPPIVARYYGRRRPLGPGTLTNSSPNCTLDGQQESGELSTRTRSDCIVLASPQAAQKGWTIMSNKNPMY